MHSGTWGAGALLFTGNLKVDPFEGMRCSVDNALSALVCHLQTGCTGPPATSCATRTPAHSLPEGPRRWLAELEMFAGPSSYIS